MLSGASRTQETGLLWTRFRVDVILVEKDERGSIISDYYWLTKINFCRLQEVYTFENRTTWSLFRVRGPESSTFWKSYDMR